MKRNILKCLAAFSLVFAAACQKNDSGKGARDEEVKAFTGLWMEERLVNPEGGDISSYFSAVSIKPDLSYVNHSDYNGDNEQKAPEIKEQVFYKLALTDHKVAQLKIHENVIAEARSKGMPEGEIQEAIKAYNKNPSTISLNEDNSQLVLKSAYTDSETKELKNYETKFVRITQEIYQKKASEYLVQANLVYNEKVRVLGIVSGHSYELVEKVTQSKVDSKTEETLKASEIQEERSFNSTDGKAHIEINVKNIDFANSPKSEALINGKYTVSLFFSSSSIKDKFNLYFSKKSDENSNTNSWINTYGEVITNNFGGIDIIQDNGGSSKTFWRYRTLK